MAEEARAGGAAWMIALELAAACALVVAGALAWLTPSSTPWLFALGWASLLARRRGWGSVGLRAPASWPRVTGQALVLGAALQFASLYGLEPLIRRFTGELPDVSAFSFLQSNPGALLQMLVFAWVLAAFGEETVYRGYLLERFETLAGGGRAGAGSAVVATSAIFGVAHYYQGPSGMIATAVMGAAFAGIYLGCGRNLWLPILTHGFFDTVAFAMIYFGVYPGMGGSG